EAAEEVPEPTGRGEALAGRDERRRLADRLDRGELGEVAGPAQDAQDRVPALLGAGHLGQAELRQRLLGGNLPEVHGAQGDVAEEVPESLGRGETGPARRPGLRRGLEALRAVLLRD